MAVPTVTEASDVCPVPPLETAKAVLNVRDVPDAAAKIKVPVNVGLTDRTLFPVPVFAIETRFFDASVATACEAVRPDNCKLVPVAAPILGVTNTGEVDNTTEPEPVEVVVPVPPLATAKAELKVSDVAEAAPSVGVTNTGEVDNTTEPLPVDDVTPVPPLATGNVPDTPVARLTVAGAWKVGGEATPLDVRINPDVEGVIPVNGEVPLPMRI